MKVTHSCPAKVNLFLEVVGKRPDGYHEIATLFAKISWCDILTVEAQPADATDISLTITGPTGKFLRANERNLVYRAARGFLEHFSLNAQLTMSLDKRIPLGAGLGGGSSDAAHTLLALCEIFGKDKNELFPLAAQIGADVPLFMLEDTFLRGEGIGEKLTPVASHGDLPYLVLVYPNMFIPTKEIFSGLQLPDPASVKENLSKLEQLQSHLYCGNPLSSWKQLLFNRLEERVFPSARTVQDVALDLQQAGAEAVLMSGSGSTVFALVKNKQQARELADKIRGKGRTVFCTPFYRNSQRRFLNSSLHQGQN